MINLDNTLFNIDIAGQQPAIGKLLVAEPFLGESYFNHAVITLIDYEKGKKSMGIVMNRLTPFKVGEIIDGFDDNFDAPIYCGGPVSADRLFYIHRLGNVLPNAVQISHELWIGGDYNALKSYVAEGYPTKGKIRFFIGYSGWDEDQLEEELRKHVWAVANPLPASGMLKGSDDAYWHKVVRSMGEPYKQWLMHPMYPSYN